MGDSYLPEGVKGKTQSGIPKEEKVRIIGPQTPDVNLQIRMAALQAAATVNGTRVDNKDQVIEHARVFESYLRGDYDERDSDKWEASVES